jgi:hypothetical protein
MCFFKQDHIEKRCVLYIVHLTTRFPSGPEDRCGEVVIEI